MNQELTLINMQDKGFRLTKVRKELVKLFSQSHNPMSCSQIEQIFRKSRMAVNKTTLYRELKFLSENGYLKEVHIRPESVSYESAKLTHHHHLVCRDCGKVENVTNCLAAGFNEDVYKRKGFRIEEHNLEFYGHCAKCLDQT